MTIRENTIASVKSGKLRVGRSSEIFHAAQIHDDERDLVRRLREGDECAFETLVRKFAPTMLSVARRFLSEGQDAQDVVQNALISAVKAIHGFAHQAQLSTWLHRIVVNAALMELRNRRRRAEHSIEDLLPRFDNEGKRLHDNSDFFSFDQLSTERHETRQLVRRCIAQLPDSYRTVLLMRDIEDLDTSEIAHMLNASTNAVKVRLHRARQALRPILQRELRAELSPTD
jgi:RNA polymerase sigma-70 factor, ECF subfamily